jgi:hypothetical protein
VFVLIAPLYTSRIRVRRPTGEPGWRPRLDGEQTQAQAELGELGHTLAVFSFPFFLFGFVNRSFFRW